MHDLLQILTDKHIPIDSVNDTAQYLGMSGQGIGQQPDGFYLDTIKKLTGKTITESNSDILRITHSYLVCGVIGALENADIIDTDNVLYRAQLKANKMFIEQPWHFAKPEVEEKLDANGKAKPKKGAKKELAMEVYREFIRDKITVRKEAIAILVEKVDMTPAGASTYYANLKKNDGVL